MAKTLLFIISFLFGLSLQAQTVQPGTWQARILRDDTVAVPFTFDVKTLAGKPQFTIRNAGERIAIKKISRKGDSLFFEMPVFEAAFRVKLEQGKRMQGWFIRGTTAQFQQLPFEAWLGSAQRFPVTQKPVANISGRWSVSITRPNNTERPAIAEFKQNGSALTGTMLTPSGDYRYMEGVVDGDSLKLSVFDGAHFYLFTAHIDQADQISGGIFYAGKNAREKWRAIKNAKAELPDVGNTPQLRPGQSRLSFRFPDLDSNIVSINDERFRNKVVIVQLMGSWCPNCMDETRFLSEFYRNNKQLGIEVVALAYENSTDFQRSRNSIAKFRDRFGVTYPMLITGVWVNDSLRTEKTLPELTSIKVFPTTIFIGRDGTVRRMHAGFYGPGTGEYYEAFKREFELTIRELLK